MLYSVGSRIAEEQHQWQVVDRKKKSVLPMPPKWSSLEDG
jgi:hypothetical protein